MENRISADSDPKETQRDLLAQNPALRPMVLSGFCMLAVYLLVFRVSAGPGQRCVYMMHEPVREPVHIWSHICELMYDITFISHLKNLKFCLVEMLLAFELPRRASCPLQARFRPSAISPAGRVSA